MSGYRARRAVYHSICGVVRHPVINVITMTRIGHGNSVRFYYLKHLTGRRAECGHHQARRKRKRRRVWALLLHSIDPFIDVVSSQKHF